MQCKYQGRFPRMSPKEVFPALLHEIEDTDDGQKQQLDEDANLSDSIIII